MKRTCGKWIALLLVFVMTVGMIPAAFAFDPNTDAKSKDVNLEVGFSTDKTSDYEIVLTGKQVATYSVTQSGTIVSQTTTKDKDTGKTYLVITGKNVGKATVTVSIFEDSTKKNEIARTYYNVNVFKKNVEIKLFVGGTAVEDMTDEQKEAAKKKYVNDSIQMKAEVTGPTGKTTDVTWKSSDTSAAFVYESGKVEFLKTTPGSKTVTITATSKQDTKVSASFEFDVWDKDTITKVKDRPAEPTKDDTKDVIEVRDDLSNEDMIKLISGRTFVCEAKKGNVTLPLIQDEKDKPSNFTFGTKTVDDVDYVTVTGKLNLSNTANNIEYSMGGSETQEVVFYFKKFSSVFTSHPQDATYELGKTMSPLTAAIKVKDSDKIEYIKWYGVENEIANPVFSEDKKVYTDKTSVLSTLNLNDIIKQPGKYAFYCEVKHTGSAVAERSKIAIITVTGQYKIELTMAQNTVSVGQNLNVTAAIKTYNANATTADKYVAYNGRDLITWTVSETKLATFKNGTTINGETQTVTAKATENGNDKIVKITVKASIDGKELTAERDITIKAAAPEDIKLVVLESADVPFTGVSDKLAAAVRAKTNNITPTYIRLQTPDYGTLYTTTSKSSRVEANRDYTMSDLDKFCLTANMDQPANTIQYVAYNADGAVAKGRIVVSTKANRIEYYLSAGEYKSFDRADFSRLFAEAFSNDQLQYVTFDIGADDKLDTTRYGFLRERNVAGADILRSNVMCYYTPASNAQALGSVTFFAGSLTSKYVITIPFSAYGRSTTAGVNKLDGSVQIYVNYSKTIKTTSVGAGFLTESVASKILPEGVSANDASSYYVLFKKPSSGRMFEDYKTFVGSVPLTEAVFTNTKYYLAASGTNKTVSSLYFLPKADVYTADLVYAVYKDGSSAAPVEEGKLTFEIEKQTNSKYFTKDTNAKDSGAWASNAVDFAYANTLVNGVGTGAFGPEQSMTRAMLVTILYRAAGSPSVAGLNNPFTDLAKGAYYVDAVLWAYSKGVVNGSSPTTFNPNGRITRQDIAAILYRASGSPATSGSIAAFSDSASVSSYATNAMRWAVQNGIITGTTVKNVARLDPTGNATRAQVVVMLHRFLTQ